jgi:hypothetical protein
MGEWYTKMWSRGVRFHYVVSYSLQTCICLSSPTEPSQTAPLRSFPSSTSFSRYPNFLQVCST